MKLTKTYLMQRITQVSCSTAHVEDSVYFRDVDITSLLISLKHFKISIPAHVNLKVHAWVLFALVVAAADIKILNMKQPLCLNTKQYKYVEERK